MFKTDCRTTGKKLVNGHDSSTDDDPVAIGTACFWLGDQRSAEFLALEMQGKVSLKKVNQTFTKMGLISKYEDFFTS